MFKTCTECGLECHLSEFYKVTKSPDGHATKCKECTNRLHAEDRDSLRAELLEAYGGICACCGENTLEFLSIDHVNGGGSAHRRELGRGNATGVNFYRWLRREGWPQEDYQLLCHNCNQAKGYYGECPHQRVAVGTS